MRHDGMSAALRGDSNSTPQGRVRRAEPCSYDLLVPFRGYMMFGVQTASFSDLKELGGIKPASIQLNKTVVQSDPKSSDV